MKNKLITYCLLTIVIVIWGGIFVKVFSSYSSHDSIVTSLPKPRPKDETIDYQEKTFSILADYRDPFLGNVQQTKNTSIKKIKTQTPKKKIEPLPPIDFSFIKYVGLIRNPKSEKKIGMVIVHGNEFMISEGETIAELECIKPFKDSIVVLYQGKHACIKR